MKKILCIALVLSVAFSLCAITNSYAQSMGLTSMAMTDTDVVSFVNPAQTYFYDNSHALQIGVSASDNPGHGLYSDPSVNLTAVFSAKRIALGFSSDVYT